ncbi:unnamed protein product, partial [Urochloa humidicola]
AGAEATRREEARSRELAEGRRRNADWWGCGLAAGSTGPGRVGRRARKPKAERPRREEGRRRGCAGAERISRRRREIQAHDSNTWRPQFPAAEPFPRDFPPAASVSLRAPSISRPRASMAAAT